MLGRETARIVATLAIGAALVVGCGESRQEKFERALRQAEAARVDLEAAREQLTRSEASYEEAHKAAERAEGQLEAARHDLDGANDRLEAARAEVLKWAPDGTLPPEMQAPLAPAARSASESTEGASAEPAALD